MAYNPYPSLTKKLQPYGTSATVGAGPGYTQQQVLDSLAANPYAAGSNGTYFQGDLTGSQNIPGQANGTGGGGNPGGIDWASIISGDPAYQQTLADLKAANIGDQAGRDAAIRRAIINFGQVPDLQAAQQALGFNLGPIVDQQTQQLAGQNQYSTEANLQHNQQLGIQKLRSALAARGALQSGELPFQLSEQNRAFGQAQNTAMQNLLDALAGYQGQYTNAVNGRTQTSTQALLDALTRAIGLYGASAGGGTSGGGGGGGVGQQPTGTQTTSPAQNAAPTVAQAIQNYGIGANQQQRVNYIGS